MTVSAVRTVVLPASPRLWNAYDGTFTQAQPDDSLDYSIDATAPLADANDQLRSLELTVTPSGTGELVASELTASGTIISFTGAGGVAGRPYEIAVTATGVSGRRWNWLLLLPLNRISASGPTPPAPDRGPSAPITWSYPMSLGYEQITNLAGATGLTPPTGTQSAVFIAEFSALRWRDDGEEPTATVGMPLLPNDPYTYQGPFDAIQFIQESGGGVLNVTYY